jgi:very-short-patch-repair endonuclease
LLLRYCRPQINYEHIINKNINPWEISYGSQKKVWIKCQEKDYHGSYETTCDRFTTQQRRCPYCCKSKIHPKDSLGQYIIDNYGEDFLSKIWSNKNKKSSFQYSPQANQKVWWKCLDGKHDDYARNIDSSTRYNYRCPSCTIFKGEIKIEDWLIKNHIIFKSQKTFKKCKYKQVLQFDFYLAQHNLLIEYQGEQHEKPIDFAGKGEEWANKLFQVNKTKDEIKKQFAISSNISLLEIWYWDYNNIEEILDNIIIKKNYNNKYFMRNKTKTA